LAPTGVLNDGYSTASKLEINTKSDLNGGTGLKAIFNRASASSVTSTLKATTNTQGVDIEADVNGGGEHFLRSSPKFFDCFWALSLPPP